MNGNKKGIAFYMHSGSGNHGCEAIADSLLRQLKDLDAPKPVTVITNSAAEDKRYGIQNMCRVVEEQHIADKKLDHTLYYGWRKLTGDKESFMRYRFAGIRGKNAPKLAVSIGGDNYCYPSMVSDLGLANSMLVRQGTKTMLLGCSIEPGLLRDENKESHRLIEDLRNYSMILARETRTYNALRGAGIDKDKLKLVPDPAFALPAGKKTELPDGFDAGNMVGLNLSPMVGDYATDPDAAMRSYETLIRHILDNSDMNVLLIPHVVWDRSNDLTPLRILYGMFKDTERVALIDDMNAEDLKGVIAACRFFIGARTHATIAAYSLEVPTLVLGYSVKSIGIAEDIFGTSNNYVLRVQDLKADGQMTAAYDWLASNENDIRSKLHTVMPEYRNRALENGAEIMKLYQA